jgi:hypothetical protein
VDWEEDVEEVESSEFGDLPSVLLVMPKIWPGVSSSSSA